MAGTLPVSYTHLDVYKRQTVYRPSQRPSLRFRMFPSPFARLFRLWRAGILPYQGGEGCSTGPVSYTHLKSVKRRLFEGCDASKYSSVCSAFDETGIEIFGTDFLAKYNDFER